MAFEIINETYPTLPGEAAPARIRAEINIEELLNTPPAIGVDIVSSVRQRFNEEDQRLYIEKCTQVNVDPDALLKTAKKNAALMTALEHARALIAEEIFEDLDEMMLDGEIGGTYPAKVINPKKYAAIKQKYRKGGTKE